jgi:hypothetical protein
VRRGESPTGPACRRPGPRAAGRQQDGRRQGRYASRRPHAAAPTRQEFHGPSPWERSTPLPNGPNHPTSEYTETETPVDWFWRFQMAGLEG